jgi:hypothetical protein
MATSLAAAAGVAAARRAGADAAAQAARLDRLGVGLFTLPTMLERDFAGTMKTLATVGYKDVEFFGPYPFSDPAAQARWKTVSASLAFRGSGYFGLAPKAVRAMLDAHGLASPSMHTDLESLRTRLAPMAEAAHTLGQRYVVLPSIPPAERQTLDGYRRIADEFNAIGRRAVTLGLARAGRDPAGEFPLSIVAHAATVAPAPCGRGDACGRAGVKFRPSGWDSTVGFCRGRSSPSAASVKL